MSNVRGSGGGGGCFPAGTTVSTPTGYKNIEDLVVGDKVVSFDTNGILHESVIEEIFIHENEEIGTLTYWRGELDITPNHWVLNQYNSFAEVGTLTCHDAVIDQLGHIRPFIDFRINRIGTVYNLSVVPHHTFIANEIRVHNGGKGANRPIIGSGGGGGGKGGGGGSYSRAPVEAPDSLRSRQYARIIDVVSEGEIEGLVSGNQSIYLDEVPLQSADGSYNFNNVTVYGRVGTQDQTYIPGFNAVENETAVATQVKKWIDATATPKVLTGGVTRIVNNPEADAIRITVAIPQLTDQNVSTGDLNGSEVQFRVLIKGNQETTASAYPVFSESIKTTNPTAISSNRFKVTVSWLADRGSLYYQPPNPANMRATVRLMYRDILGTNSWIIYQEFDMISSIVTSTDSDGNSTTEVQASTKVFEFSLPGSRYEFKLERVSGGTGTGSVKEVYADNANSIITIKGKNTTRYQTSYVIPLNKGSSEYPNYPYEITVERITDDSIKSNVQNAIWWDSYTEIVYAKMRYPNTALFGIEIDSSQFQRIPTRGYLIDGIKLQIPSNYDPIGRVHDGAWDGTFKIAWSNNPAWVFYDIIVNDRYGLGKFIDSSQVDKWALYEIAQYCDEQVPDGFGGFEPRFTCNLYLQTREEAYNVINNIASIFRGMTWWSAGTITAIQDAPGDMEAIYNPSNVVDGTFSYTGSSRKQRHTVALVSWNDPADYYKQKIEYVEDTEGVIKNGIIETEITAFGCTSRGQAHRLGKWLLFTERMETEVVSFKTGLNGARIHPGSIIATSDPIRAGKRMGGRLFNVNSSTQLVLDSPIDLLSEAYIYVCLPDGSIATKKILTTGSAVTTIDIESAFKILPEPANLYTIAFSNLTPELWRVIGTSEVDGTNIEISAVEHNPNKYALVEQDIVLPTAETSLIKSVPDSPTDLLVNEVTTIFAPAAIGIKAVVSWNSKEPGFIVRYRRSNDNWIQLPTVNGTSVDIEGLIATETYTFEVTAVNSVGIKSIPISTTAEFTGKDIPPADVPSFTAQAKDGLAIFRWGAVGNTDLAGYEIRYNPIDNTNWDDASTVTSVTKGTSVTTGIVPPGTWLFMIKAVDLTGNYSVNYASATCTLANPNVVILSRNEELYWDTGTLENMGIHYPTNSIFVKGSNAAITEGWDTFDKNIPNILPVGYYYTPVFDMQKQDTVRIMGVLISKMFPGEVGIADPNFQIRTAMAESSMYPIAWSSWQYFNFSDFMDWDVGFREARYVQFRIVADTSIGTYYITQFIPTMDRDIRVEDGSNVVVSTAGTTITFAKPFFYQPTIKVAPISATAATYTITAQSTSGFTVKVYNISGTAIAGIINWEARGA